MAQTHYAIAQEHRDPTTAAMLSVVPGLGQFYNGESRKGILFLDVAIINFILLSIILLAPVLVKFMQDFGHQYQMRLNGGVLEALRNMQFGTPVSLVVLGMIIAFVAYAVRDAYDHAVIKRRRAIYSDAILQLNEATSGSYIIHASVIVSLAVMALFFFIPKPLAKQIVEIEFLNQIIDRPPVTIKRNEPKTIVSQKRTEQQSRRFDETKPENKVAPKADLSKQNPSETKTNPAESKQAAESSHKSAPAMAKPLPHEPANPSQTAAAAPKMEEKLLIAQANPTQLPFKAFTPVVNPVKVAAPTGAMAPKLNAAVAPMTPALPTMNPAAAMANFAKTMPLPANHGTSIAQPTNLPSPIAPAGLSARASGDPMPTGGVPSSSAMAGGFKLPGVSGMPDMGGGKIFSPKVGGGPGGPGSVGRAFTGAPTMFDNARSNQTGPGGPGGRGPEPVGRSSRTGPGDDGVGQIPAPVRAPGSKSNFGPNLALMPSGGPTQSASGDRPLNLRGPEGANQVKTTPEPDFTEYMIKLQRRIKSCWFPAKDTQSRRVKVLFKIHEDGTMSNLRISTSSGYVSADQTALEAINKAAPFAHLPQYSPENVDIEFTFDYNLFSGGR